MDALLDRLPQVNTCCFCCYLRGGSFMIGLFSFMAGMIFAPNVIHLVGYWNIDPVLKNYDTMLEGYTQLCLGMVSIMLCTVSIFLMLGSLCGVAKLIEVYMWGAIIYNTVTFTIFFVTAVQCFFVNTNCLTAAGYLTFFMIVGMAVAFYFLIVVNSLRVNIKYMNYIGGRRDPEENDE